MMAMRGAVLLLVLASTFLALAEAAPLTGKFFGETERYFAKHPKAVAAFKAKYTKKQGPKGFNSFARTSTQSKKDICAFDPNLFPAGLTLCQKNVCTCPKNEHCVTYQDPNLNGLGICACGSHLCTDATGLDCAVTTNSKGKTKHMCVKPAAPPPPYVGSRLMRKALR